MGAGYSTAPGHDHHEDDRRWAQYRCAVKDPRLCASLSCGFFTKAGLDDVLAGYPSEVLPVAGACFPV